MPSHIKNVLHLCGAAIVLAALLGVLPLALGLTAGCCLMVAPGEIDPSPKRADPTLNVVMDDPLPRLAGRARLREEYLSDPYMLGWEYEERLDALLGSEEAMVNVRREARRARRGAADDPSLGLPLDRARPKTISAGARLTATERARYRAYINETEAP